MDLRCPYGNGLAYIFKVLSQFPMSMQRFGRPGGDALSPSSPSYSVSLPNGPDCKPVAGGSPGNGMFLVSADRLIAEQLMRENSAKDAARKEGG